MKEFIDKLICRLEERIEDNSGWDDDDYFHGENVAYEDAISIVNELAEEYKGGWIPCSERLPEANIPVLTCDKSGWISVNINMTYIGGVKNDFECGYYVAWMPLPAPYTEGE